MVKSKDWVACVAWFSSNLVPAQPFFVFVFGGQVLQNLSDDLDSPGASKNLFVFLPAPALQKI
jgi:hypothetical protein